MVLSERLLPRRIYIDIIEIIVDADGPYIKSCSFSFFSLYFATSYGNKDFLIHFHYPCRSFKLSN